MNVSVCFDRRYWGYYLADQLNRRDALEYLYTAYYGRWGKKRNDHGIDIPRARVRTNLIVACLLYGFNPRDDLFAERQFGTWVSRQLSGEDIVVTLGQASLPIIECAKQSSIITIKESGSSHPIYQRDILLEEYETWDGPIEKLNQTSSQVRMEQNLLEFDLVDYIAIPSSFVERTFQNEGISKDKLIKNPYGVDLSNFRQLPKRDKTFRVVFAGAMSLRKGVHYLLQAFAELDLPDAELWLLGSKLPEIEPFFERYAGTYRFFGRQPQSRLHEYYSQCSVFAMCSIEEGMAMVQMQAMACGLPLICTPNTGGEDLIDNELEGFIVPIRDVEAIKEKISYLYENQDLCFEMGQAAKSKAQRGFSWDDYGERAVGIYQSLLACDSRGLA